MEEFFDRYPDISVELLNFDRPANLIEEGIDVAIHSGDLSDSSLSEKIAETSMVLVATPGYLEQHGIPKHPKQLKQHRSVAYIIDGAPANPRAPEDRMHARLECPVAHPARSVLPFPLPTIFLSARRRPSGIGRQALCDRGQDRSTFFSPGCVAPVNMRAHNRMPKTVKRTGPRSPRGQNKLQQSCLSATRFFIRYPNRLSH
jgi:DNA-binding transcriptional LysR family regulator